MIDIHSHILPSFDDGAEDDEMALLMLRESFSQGVDRVVSTSHCYPKVEKSIHDFISDRAQTLQHLRDIVENSGEPMPQIYAGCELNLSRDISEDPDLHELCIEGTNFLLLEMPYDPWSEWCFEAVYKIGLRGITPVMAHIDRFMYQKESALNALFELNVLYQLNADCFLERGMKHIVDSLIENGRAHFLGSDMHNLAKRPPTLGKAKERIIKIYGQSYWDYFMENNARLLHNEEPDPWGYKRLEKKSFLGRIFGK